MVRGAMVRAGGFECGWVVKGEGNGGIAGQAPAFMLSGEPRSAPRPERPCSFPASSRAQLAPVPARPSD